MISARCLELKFIRMICNLAQSSDSEFSVSSNWELALKVLSKTFPFLIEFVSSFKTYQHPSSF